MSTEFGYTREIEDRVQAPCPIWLVAIAKVLSGAVKGMLAAVIVFPIAAVIHAPGVHAHLSVHWWIVLTLIPLASVAMTSLGLLLGTTFEPRNIGLTRATDKPTRLTQHGFGAQSEFVGGVDRRGQSADDGSLQ